MRPLASAHLPCQLSNAWDLLSVSHERKGYWVLVGLCPQNPRFPHLKVRAVPAAALALQGEVSIHRTWEHSNTRPRLSAGGFPRDTLFGVPSACVGDTGLCLYEVLSAILNIARRHKRSPP